MTAPVDASLLNPIELFMTADWVVKTVMIGLAAASVWSWTIIIDKAVRFARMNARATEFEKQVESGRSLEDVAAQAGPQPAGPLPRMLVSTLQDWREARARGAMTDTQGSMLIARIDRALDSVIARESQKIENGLGVLSVVATASPFIGLFGTVWGIMNAFDRIAAAGNTNLTTVAPAIAEALFATAIGLAAAIPAYIAFNAFSVSAGKFTGRLEAFADDLLVLLIIFMISAPLLTVGVPVELPKTEASAVETTDKPITVSIDKDGAIFIGDSEVRWDNLAIRVAEEGGEKARDKAVFIRADGRAPYQAVARVMARLSASGFTKLNLITDTAADETAGG